MTRKRTLVLLLVLVVLAVAAFNVSNLIEAYGSGPPYYSRTNNMDKWESPLPILLSVDSIAGISVAIGLLALRRNRRH